MQRPCGKRVLGIFEKLQEAIWLDQSAQRISMSKFKLKSSRRYRLSKAFYAQGNGGGCEQTNYNLTCLKKNTLATSWMMKCSGAGEKQGDHSGANCSSSDKK